MPQEVMLFEGPPPDRAVYTCVRNNKDQPWEISFPVGDDRFYGTKQELAAHVKKMIALHTVQE
jgi:hypothetical protein